MRAAVVLLAVFWLNCVISLNAFADDVPQTLLENFHLIEKGVGDIVFDLSFIPDLNRSWDQASDESNFARACFLTGSLKAKATNNIHILNFVEKHNPVEKDDTDLKKFWIRHNYLSIVTNWMDSVKFFSTQMTEICTNKIDAKKLRTIMNSAYAYLEDKKKDVDAERIRMIEASGLINIIRE